MAMFLISGSFRITGAQPDGDSIRFSSELSRAGPDWQEAQSFFPVSFQLAIRRWHQRARRAVQESVLAMVRKAAERVSPAETLGNRRRRRDARRRLAQRYRQAPAVDQAQQL